MQSYDTDEEHLEELSFATQQPTLNLAQRFETLLDRDKETFISAVTDAFHKFIGAVDNVETRIMRDITEMERSLHLRGEKLDEDKSQFHLEKQGFHKEKTHIQSFMSNQVNKVRINVGGSRFETTLTTLTSERGSMLEAMFSGRFPIESEDGEYFIDRDAEFFPLILNYLRDGEVEMPTDDAARARLAREAAYYGLDGLQGHLDRTETVHWDDEIVAVHTLKGHTHYILCLQFDMNTLITGSGDNNIRVWDMESGQCLKTLYGHTGFVCCLQFQDNLLISGGKDTKIILWDIKKGKRIANGILEGHTCDVQTLHMEGNLLVSGSADHTIRVWNTAERVCTAILRGHTARVTHVQFHGDRLVSGSSDRTVRVWSIHSGQCVNVLSGHTDSVFCLQFEGSRLVTGSSDKTIRIWDLNTASCVAVLEGHTGWVKCLQFQGSQLLSGGDKTIKIWDIDKMVCVKTVDTAHTNDVRCLMFRGRYLVSGSFDGTVKIWKQVQNGKHMQPHVIP
eukprot:TRINITY_DN66502_c6_g15_i2.p1 TRINITY_DN66502_c6_g15~~TRINITY_DN66502_c6_g15_i2.p1  ORF type:complete len:507 (+),score=24.93 TRINITY_DN66502_c6_g15_i2:21-1541(+)